MKKSLVRVFSLALAIAGAGASTLEGASSRVALSGGPLGREKAASLLRASPTTIRPLQPGDLLLLGPTAGPLSAPPPPSSSPAPATPFAAVSPAVDTVTVRAPASVPEGRPPAATPETWETYRTGNVVRISLP